MVNAFDPNAVVEYIPLADRARPAEEQTVFILKPLDIFAKLDVEEQYKATAEAKPKHFALYYVRKSLVGWRNFKTAAGVDLKFTLDGGCASDDAIRIAGAFINELFDACVSANAITAEQVGKS